MKADVIIIGGGPSALTAATYTLRGGKSVIVLEKEAFGGQIADSPRVENFPSVPSISGMDLVNRMVEQVQNLGGDLEMDEAISVTPSEDGFEVKGRYGIYTGKAVILATGVKHRKLGIPGEEKFSGHGVSFCAVCDGPFYSGKNAMVIGDANTALQYAIFLAAQCPHVDLITLFDRFFADAMLIQTLEKLPNVTITHNYAAQSFNGTDVLQSVTFKDTKTGVLHEIPTVVAFVAIGQVPDNERFASIVTLDKGFIVTDEEMATKTPGIFSCGDCRKKHWRQLTTACGDGAIASLSAQNYLIQKE
jgi:thioredoxin reductase (NADPH)